MITETDLNISNQSYTHKDFYQIYPEILDLVKKITKKWDPTSSNESDPGVVLLKLLSFIADKNNYNIDKNILEWFMPSCTQEESMRNLCNMMGYDMGYYKSATTDVSVMYTGTQNSVTLKAFDTVFTNEDEDIKYILLEDMTLIPNETSTKIAIEGELVQLQIGEDNIVRLTNLDDNNKLYLSEPMIASNGVFIANSDLTNTSVFFSSDEDDTIWKQVSNLNSQLLKRKVWQFGFDSIAKLPYIQFPDDIVNLIEDGLVVYYIRTSGVNGNISANVLTKLANTTTLVGGDETEEEIIDGEGNSILTIKNLSATYNGKDKETIDDAYNNFKKTVGTFDTLTTCRDYANAIYNMVDRSTSSPYISNCQVGDIRNNLNDAVSIITFNNNASGVSYINKTIDETSSGINYFDLFIYPLNLYNHTSNYKTNVNNYIKSFEAVQDEDVLGRIKEELKDYKTISHKIINYNNTENYLVKNLLKLNCRVITAYKVGTYEEAEILTNIRNALFNNFNPRQIDYGEEIPYEKLLSVIQNSDVRIKNVILDEPGLETKIQDARNNTYDLFIDENYYYPYVAKNVLAGRVPLFDYYKNINVDFGMSGTEVSGGNNINWTDIDTPANDSPITRIKTKLNKSFNAGEDTELYKNEIVQIISPKFSTEITYGLYVNYEYAGSTTIEVGKIVQLQPDDTLTIRYKDSSGTAQEKTYSDGTYIKCTNISLENGSKGNFSSNQQIEILKLSSAELSSTMYCYWITDNQNNEFTWDSKNEHLLSENEYFFYTNAIKNELVQLGSGTLLKLSSSPNVNDWKFSSDNTLNIDDVVNDGLSAFKSIEWKQIDFSTNNLTIQEQEIISLSEKALLKFTTYVELDSDWKSLASNDLSYYKLNSSSEEQKLTDKGDNAYQIRSKLMLSVSPDKAQELLTGHKVILYSCQYKDTYGQPLSYPIRKANIKSYGEYEEIKQLTETTIKSNYEINFSGGTLNTTISSIDDLYYKNDLNIASFNYEQPKLGDETINFASNFANISLTSGKNVSLPVSIPNDNQYGLFMCYVFGNEPISISNTGGNIRAFNSNEGIIGLPGLNIIQIDYGCTEITISSSNDTNIIISNLDIVNKGDNGEGINPNLLLNNDSSDASILLDKLQYWGQDSEQPQGISKNLFYYNAPLENELIIGVDRLDSPLALYDYNNVYNKFTLSEIDVDSLDNIQIYPSSKLKSQ